MQRPRCEANLPDYLVCESIHSKQCSKKDRECWEWLHGTIYNGADVVCCAHCGQRQAGEHKDGAGERVCDICAGSLRYRIKCARCGAEIHGSTRDRQYNGKLYCSIECAADDMEMEQVDTEKPDNADETGALGKICYERLGAKIGAVVDQKQEAYGDSFGRAGQVLRVLYPDGISPNQYDDALAITRIIDKLFRIANQKTAFGESPYKDLAGYALLGAGKD